jgi:hypothetical protein
MSDEAMQRLIGNAMSANSAVGAALRQLSDEAPSVSTRIGRLISAVEAECDDIGSDDDAIDLVDLVTEGLRLRWGKSAEETWVVPSNGAEITVWVVLLDEGEIIAEAIGYGVTRWVAARNLALVSGYDCPGGD